MTFISRLTIGMIIIGSIAMITGREPGGWMLGYIPVHFFLFYANIFYQSYKSGEKIFDDDNYYDPVGRTYTKYRRFINSNKMRF